MSRVAAVGALVLVACGVNVTLGTLPTGEGGVPVPGDALDASAFDACLDDVCEPPSWDAAVTPDDASFEVDSAGLDDASTD